MFCKAVLRSTVFSICFVWSYSAHAQEALQSLERTRPAIPDYVETEKTSDFELPKARPPISQNNNGAPSFLLQAIKYQGNSVYSDAELNQVVQDKLQQQVTLGDLEELRLRITNLYIKNGYINSGAVLPEQSIRDGIVTIEIVEGKLTEIELSGNLGLSDDYIISRLVTDPNAVFNLPAFQEEYQLLLSDPLINKLNGQFVPSEHLGQSKLKLQVERAKSHSVDFQTDNYGSASSGETQGSLSLQTLNLSGAGDSLYLKLRKREGAIGAELDYARPLNSSTSNIGVRLGYNDTEVIAEQLQSLDIQSDFKSAEVYITHPLIRSLKRQLTLGLSLSVRENQGELLDIPFSFAAGEQDGFSRVAAVRIGLTGIIRDENQAWSMYARYSQGLDMFNPTFNQNGLPDNNFSSLLLQLQYARRLNDDTQLLLRTDAQISDSPLLALEQIAIGGARTVRGYRENELVRDTGYIVSAEIESSIWDNLDYSGRLGSLQAFVFTDYGEGSYKRNVLDSAKPLLSVGGGFRWQGWDRVEMEVIYGHAIREAQEKADEILQDRGIHLRLNCALF